MRAVIPVLLLLTVSLAAQTLPAKSAQQHESKKFRKQREKIMKANAKRAAEEAAWEEATRPPDPGFPGSLRPEFISAAAQATIVIDNAFNAMEKSRIEFAIANQSSIQYAAALAGLAQTDGERQVAAILYDYSQRIPLCQELAWEAFQSVLTLAVRGGEVRGCTREARRLRAQADRTFLRNK